MFGKLNKIRSAGEVRYGAVAAFGENAGLGTGKFKARREILRLGNEIAYVMKINKKFLNGLIEF